MKCASVFKVFDDWPNNHGPPFTCWQKLNLQCYFKCWACSSFRQWRSSHFPFEDLIIEPAKTYNRKVHGTKRPPFIILSPLPTYLNLLLCKFLKNSCSVPNLGALKLGKTSQSMVKSFSIICFVHSPQKLPVKASLLTFSSHLSHRPTYTL